MTPNTQYYDAATHYNTTGKIGNGHATREGDADCAIQFIRAYNIAPAEVIRVKQGHLLAYFALATTAVYTLLIGADEQGREIIGTITMGQGQYSNTSTPQLIADDLYRLAGGDITVAEVSNA